MLITRKKSPSDCGLRLILRFGSAAQSRASISSESLRITQFSFSLLSIITEIKFSLRYSHHKIASLPSTSWCSLEHFFEGGRAMGLPVIATSD
ncbi:unnamed protein product [Calypogeia fissa]